jgi:pimeloyl-ACP methyl ester carboxylesterase
LLFVHGAWHSSWCWDEHFLSYFADHGYISHALDLRGHGKSEGADRLRWTRIKDYVADVDSIVRQFEQPPVLIGHSMGGLVLQKYLETHQVPAAILLASCPPSGVLRTTLHIAVHHPIPLLKANGTLRLYPIVSTPSLAQEAFFSAQMPQEQVKAYFTRLQDESYMAFLDMMIFSLPHPDRVTSPVLVLGGEYDTIFNRKEVEATARAYHTQATFFPVAHDMMLEDAWQDVADYMLTWLQSRDL